METLSFPITRDYLVPPRTERSVVFNSNGLNKAEYRLVRSIAEKVFRGVERRFPGALLRCTFYAEYGYPVLVKAISKSKSAIDPKIKGCDANPFDQHYWLSFSLQRGTQNADVLIDPIFGYVGLEDKAREVLSSDYLRYYRESRTVSHGIPAWEGGIRIKTIGI